MISGIYYGAQYGGSTTAILINLPGESASVVTTLDGHKMAQNGRAGSALAIAALASFFAGTVTTMLIAGSAPTLARMAFAFGPAEYFSLVVLGLIASIVLAHGSLLKSLGMIVAGLAIGTVGIDVNSGASRFSFGFMELSSGVEFVALAMGFFAFADIIANAPASEERRTTATIGRLWPNRQEAREATPATLRGTALGSFLGLLPGGGATLASFAAYTLEKRVSRKPERFGQGAPQGVAGPEAANNAGAQASFIPMLTLGLPGNGVMALIIGAMMIHNIQPGPQVASSNPTLFWGLIASMWIGNLMLVILNLPLIAIWVQLLRIRFDTLFPAILVFCCIGLFSVQGHAFEIYLAAFFGVVGYLMARLKCEPAPLLLGFILGPMLEENLVRALLLNDGDFGVFFTRPISLTLLLCAAGLLTLVALPMIRSRRKIVFAEEE